MKWADCVTRMGQKTNAHKVSVEKISAKKLLQITKLILKYNIKKVLKKENKRTWLAIRISGRLL